MEVRGLTVVTRSQFPNKATNFIYIFFAESAFFFLCCGYIYVFLPMKFFYIITDLIHQRLARVVFVVVFQKPGGKLMQFLWHVSQLVFNQEPALFSTLLSRDTNCHH